MEIEIEKMIYGGDGLGRYRAADEDRSKAVFVPFVLEKERVAVEVIEDKRSFARGRAQQVLRASAHRVEPDCPYFQRCGGCHYQHSSYEHQLEIKLSILRETLLRTGKIDWPKEIAVHPSPPWNYRNRTRMKLAADPFALGYYQFRSHRLLPVEQCPISSPLINRTIAAVWELGRAGKIPSEIAELEFFANAGDDELLVESYCRQSTPSLATFGDALRERLAEIKGVTFFRDSPEKSLALTETEPAALQYRTRGGDFRVSAGSFFQTNRFLVDEFQSLVTADARGSRALDLFAGTGLFSLPLAQRFERLTAVESAPASFGDLEHNAPANLRPIRKNALDFVAATGSEKFDYVVVDPPRAGLGEELSKRLSQLAAPRLTYVSCDPATLARDLRVLIAGGYQMTELHLVDLFPQTFHIETVARLTR
jgi:23S rRNA (uracil1939-C5)-methyltransferase